MFLTKIIYQPFVVTSLLLILYYSCPGLYASLTVFSITVVVTYICFTLKTQLKLEHLFKIFSRYFFRYEIAKSPDEEDFISSHKKQDGLKLFPKPIAKILQKFIDSIIRDFIKTWYLFIGPDEEDFIQEVRTALEYAFTEVYFQLEKADIHNLTVSLIRMFQRHAKVFDDCRTIIQNKYSGISEDDFSSCISELYEAGVIKHIGTRNKGTEIDYLKTLLDIFLYKFLPKDAFSCEGGRFLLREILAIQLLEPLVKVITDTHFVNQIVINVLDPSIPLPILIERWKNAMNEIKKEEEEELSKEQGKEKEIVDCTASETNFESSVEYNKNIQNESLDINRHVQSESSDTKYSSPRHSLANDQSNTDLIRFNKLDIRTSAPVYGSKSARDHETSKPTDIVDTTEDDESEVMHSRKYPYSVSSTNDDTDILDAVSSGINTDLSWGVCPPATARIYKKDSFRDMLRTQDEISEQVKAKLKSIGSTMTSISPVSSCRNKTKVRSSLEGSVTMDFYKKEVSRSDSEDSEDSRKIHDSGPEGAFYESAPTCPTCVEMTSLASPFDKGKSSLVFNPDHGATEHECGLNTKHFYCPETITENIIVERFDDQSFASCTYNEVSDESFSSGTLLASNESFGSSCKKLLKKVEEDSYDIVSSRSENSNSSDGEISTSYDDIENLIYNDNMFDHKTKYRHRTPSVATFRTAIEHSVASLDPSEDKIIQKNLNDRKKNANHVFKFFKSGLSGFSKQKMLHSTKTGKTTVKRSHRNKANKKRFTKHKEIPDETNKCESSSISTSITKFNSIPDNSTSIPIQYRDSFMGNFIEEVALEAVEDEQYLDEVQDAKSQFYSSSPDSLPVDPLSKEIAVTDSRSIKSIKSIKSDESSKKDIEDNSGNGKSEYYIPIFQGEIIKPHPSKLPANWLYPIQMISIPSTEVATEKGWEPGINKYTLYSIHYDIRIWPDQYQKQVIKATNEGVETLANNAVPLIREIKRRYREFLFLHNRFTHGAMSKNMKGILRPNRRYAMPFGRMDPDVIEGRRKILETYLVSLVSRPELCNSREFKDFLGSEDSQIALLKPKKIGKKQMYNPQVNKIVVDIKPSDFHAQRDNIERFDRGLGTQYFIHGYEVPRMFGYSAVNDIRKHSMSWFYHFVENYHDMEKSFNKKKIDFQNVFETVQKPKIFHLPEDTSNQGELGPRTAGDGAEAEAIEQSVCIVRFDETVKKHDGKTTFNEKVHSIQIAAKFSEELATQLHDKKESLALAREEDLYESSWPLTDAVLSIACQVLKGYGSWLTFESVQQAILFSLGGVIEWLIQRELHEVVMQERCFKYLTDLYYVVWNDKDQLREREAEPTAQQRKEVKQGALEGVMEILPSFIMMSIGPSNYHKCCENLLHILQYQNINRHVLYAALEIFVLELVPEMQENFTDYVATATATNTKSSK